MKQRVKRGFDYRREKMVRLRNNSLLVKWAKKKFQNWELQLSRLYWVSVSYWFQQGTE